MSAQIYQFRDYQSKAAIERAHKALEDHFIAMEKEMALALWGQDAGTVGLADVPNDYDPRPA